MTNKQVELFLAKISALPNGCWEWSACRNRLGYGVLGMSKREQREQRRTTLAHRLSYEHFVADIAAGCEIDHLCRNASCVNPTHLEPVTHTVNVQRGAAGALISEEARRSKSRLAISAGIGVNPTYRSLAIRGALAAAAARTHCRRGHEWTPANTYVSPARPRYRYCRECSRIQQRARRREEQAA